MINIHNEFIYAVIISLSYILLFLSCEVIYRKFKILPEYGRKLTHLLSGVVASFFPFIFHSTITIFILSILFTLILYFARRLNLLKSIGSVERKSYGEIYFPISIFFLFALSHTRPVIYVISILLLTISDPVAAIIGKTYGTTKYVVQKDKKSLEGSFMFFLSSFFIVHIPLLLFTGVSRGSSLLISFLVALLVTIIESVSMEGIDNLLIPIGAFIILSKLLTKPFEMVLLNVMAFSLVLIMCVVLSVRSKKISFSGVIVLALFGYTAWMLGGIAYYLVFILSFLFFLFMNVVFYIKTGEDAQMFHVRPVFYLVIIPFLIIFLANLFSKERVLFPVFLQSAGVQFTLLWRQYFLDERVQNKFFARNRNIFSNLGPIFSGIFIFIIPIIYFKPEYPLMLALLFLIFCFIGDIVYLSIRKHSSRTFSINENRRMREYINLFIVIMYFIVQNVLLLILKGILCIE